MVTPRALVRLAAAAAVLAACGSQPAPHPSRTATAPPTATASATAAPTPSPTAVPPPATHPAPALVQVENLDAARPQSGLSYASSIFEYATEGGITRFTVVYTSPPPGAVGPVRSARLVSVTLDQNLHGLLLYSGSSTVVGHAISGAHLPAYNETTADGGLFRISSRYPPHNLYTDGPHIARLLARASLQPVAWQPWPTGAPAAGGSPSPAFRVPLSALERPVYRWDGGLHGYVRTEPDTGTFTDADTGRPVVAATVVVMQVHVTVASYVEDVNGVHGLEYTLDAAGGPAQFFTGGMMWPGHWSQGPSGPPSFTVGAGPAPIAPGLVWICLVPMGQPAF